MATSGDSAVVLLGHPAAALVRAVGAIARAPVGPYAIVGGVAVAVRLGTAHRATTDVDTVVYDGTEPAAVEVLSALSGAVRDVASDHRVFLDDARSAAAPVLLHDHEREAGLRQADPGEDARQARADRYERRARSAIR